MLKHAILSAFQFGIFLFLVFFHHNVQIFAWVFFSNALIGFAWDIHHDCACTYWVWVWVRCKSTTKSELILQRTSSKWKELASYNEAKQKLTYTPGRFAGNWNISNVCQIINIYSVGMLFVVRADADIIMGSEMKWTGVWEKKICIRQRCMKISYTFISLAVCSFWSSVCVCVCVEVYFILLTTASLLIRIHIFFRSRLSFLEPISCFLRQLNYFAFDWFSSLGVSKAAKAVLIWPIRHERTVFFLALFWCALC